MSNNIGLLIDYEDNTILQSFEEIEVGGTYSTIDKYGVITYVLITNIDGDYIEFDEMSAFTSEGEGTCMVCGEEFEILYDDRVEMFGIEPIATCPNCEAQYSHTCLIDPSEIGEVEYE